MKKFFVVLGLLILVLFASTASATSYVVSNAGTTACNGTYNEYSTNDGVTSYKHETNEMYLFRVDGPPPNKAWDISATHGGGTVLYEGVDVTNGDTPYIGTYNIIAGAPPAAVVSEGAIPEYNGLAFVIVLVSAVAMAFFAAKR